MKLSEMSQIKNSKKDQMQKKRYKQGQSRVQNNLLV